jgi:hypothetical protein
MDAKYMYEIIRDAFFVVLPRSVSVYLLSPRMIVFMQSDNIRGDEYSRIIMEYNADALKIRNVISAKIINLTAWAMAGKFECLRMPLSMSSAGNVRMVYNSI